MPANDGKSAEQAFEQLIDADVLYRFPDQRDLVGLNNRRRVGAFPVPSDYLVTKDCQTFFAEVKSIAGGVSFPFSDIRPAQRSMALRQAAAVGDYRFYIYSRELRKWFVMPAYQFAELIKAGRKSVKLKELHECIFS